MSVSTYVGRDSTRFPARLVTITPRIDGLWYRGKWQLVTSDRLVAIVGSRKMSRYGKQVLAELIPRLVQAGWMTISGFMYGIDIEVARLTIEHGGIHVAAVGWGIDRENDVEDVNLYHKLIEKDGLLLSELSGTTRSQIWTYPRRNRVVVGLAHHVIVIEAGANSGSLNSASWGRRLGKDVYAVPGSIFSSVSVGTNQLIQDGLAKSLTLATLQEMYPVVNNYSKKVSIHPSKSTLNESERIIVTLLRLEGPQSVNEISRHTTLPAGNVSSQLTDLLIRGIVEEEKGLYRIL